MMLKITFTTPQRIIQHGLEQECMFVVCLSARPMNHMLCFDTGDDIVSVYNYDVKLIEPYKP